MILFKFPFFSDDRDELYSIDAALRKFGSLDALFDALMELQNSPDSGRAGIYAFALPGRENELQIRMTIDPRKITRQQAAAWLTKHGVPVKA